LEPELVAKVMMVDLLAVVHPIPVLLVVVAPVLLVPTYQQPMMVELVAMVLQAV
jgi:hypothetical protein